MACFKCGADTRVIDGILRCVNPTCGCIVSHQLNEREILLTERTELVNIIKDLIDLLRLADYEHHEIIERAEQRIANLYETH